MPKRPFRNIIKSILVLLFLGAGLPKMYAGSMLLSHRISLNIQKQSIDKVLHQIEKKAKVLFMYNPQMFNLKQTITVHIENSSLENVLQTIINNRELVFYEMGSYIVITNKHQAPLQATVIPAFVNQNDDKLSVTTNRLVVDTIHFYDTVKITKTITQRNIVQDTIRIYDTITKILTKTINSISLPEVVQKENDTKRSYLYMQASLAPLYTTMLNNKNWFGAMSVSAQAMVGVKMNACKISIGLESFVQHGTSKSTQISQTTDSLLQRDTIHILQKFKTGDYFYLSGKDTIDKVIYDSALVAVPRQWCKNSIHQKIVESQVTFSIYWIVIPCKIEYEMALSKKTNFALGLTLSPAFAIKQYGQIYDPQQQKIVDLAHLSISSFNLFSSIECSLAYALDKNLSVYCSPMVQCSLRSLLQSSSYYVGTGVCLGITKRF